METKTFQAAVVKRYTGDPKNYTISEFPYPTVESNQVEISVHAASLNPIDYKRAKGLLLPLQSESLPLKLGYDVAGTITKVGTDVTSFAVGDKVYGRVKQKDVGTIAEVAVVDADVLAKIPEEVPFTVAAGVGLAGLTAKQALDSAGLDETKSLFVSGGMGGVGMFAIMLAKHHYNAKEIITTVSSGKVDRVKELGATRVIDYTKESYTEALENEVDVAFDTVGDSNISKVVKPGGSAISVALLPEGNELEKLKRETGEMSMLSKIRLEAVKRVADLVGWYNKRGFKAKNINYRTLIMHPNGKELEETFNPLLASEKIKPAIANIYPFTIDGVQKAFAEAIDGHAAGKIIISVKD
ncbi:hypothetical protein IWW36_002670 [Coemansia brasiliensis]|uniref:Enoyl reductase (ER) domain-containing protein n=1 Tax=Coemansia brasiliensis TaxID=2650707 RepID=A0A9W8M0F4_9FUNG|nr:hypothetical protein IWW36_002670 [Coemansia brasiliensis]